MNVSFDDLKKMIMSYNSTEIEIVTKAYEYAKFLVPSSFNISFAIPLTSLILILSPIFFSVRISNTNSSTGFKR